MRYTAQTFAKAKDDAGFLADRDGIEWDVFYERSHDAYVIVSEHDFASIFGRSIDSELLVHTAKPGEAS